MRCLMLKIEICIISSKLLSSEWKRVAESVNLEGNCNYGAFLSIQIDSRLAFISRSCVNQWIILSSCEMR